jgi:hypothetical protein
VLEDKNIGQKAEGEGKASAHFARNRSSFRIAIAFRKSKDAV